MRKLYTAALAAPIALALAMPMSARAVTTGLSAEVGGNYLMNKDARNATQDTGIHVGVAYRLPSMAGSGMGTRSSTQVGGVYNRNSGHGNRLEVIGLTVDQRYDFSAAGAVTGGTVPYAGIGVGVYRIKAKGHKTVADEVTPTAVSSTTTTVSETKTRFGGRAFAGMDFGGRLYAELSYNMIGKIAGVRADSITLGVGARF